MSNENNRQKHLGVALVLAGLGMLALIAAKFLWAFTAWYEWIALGIAFLFLAGAGAVINRHAITVGKQSDDEGTI